MVAWFNRSVGLGIVTLGLLAQPAIALPGQSVRVVETWMRNNPTLRPRPHERLTINRVAAPGQRFIFQASVFPVTGVQPDVNRRTIRTERFTFVDHANPITSDRLEESLRLIYGPEVFNDYRQAEELYRYPLGAGTAATDNPNLRLRGHVRQGEQFAYWQELAYDQNGHAYLGRMAVLLKADLPLLQAHLVGDE
ncbi:MAG: hypothetical protein EA342_10530 [Leptolyngbya sp. LCM1.Bin17]|nr:MAG: hypothetical protein EA342_10530 [Leptolyngbya sp. LCM1.Bin17]